MTIHTVDLEFQGSPETIASFVLESDEGPVLVEAGPGSTRDTQLAGLKRLGIEPEEVKHVLLTHIHLDHAGNAGWWAREGATVYVHPRGVRHLIEPETLWESARVVYGDRLEPLWGDMLAAPEERVRSVAGGEHLEIGGLEFEAIETPGHARHHHVWALPKEGVAFAGDAAGARLPGQAFLSVTSAPPQFDPESFQHSLDALGRRAFERLFLTHFGEIVGSEAVADHLRHCSEVVNGATTFGKERLDEGMDEVSLQVAYRAWCWERAFQNGTAPEVLRRYEVANGSEMCADGIRLYWERRERDEAPAG